MLSRFSLLWKIDRRTFGCSHNTGIALYTAEVCFLWRAVCLCSRDFVFMSVYICCAIAHFFVTSSSIRVFNLVKLEALRCFFFHNSSPLSLLFALGQTQFIYVCLFTPPPQTAHISLLIIFKYLFIFHLTLIEGER